MSSAKGFIADLGVVGNNPDSRQGFREEALTVFQSHPQ